MELHRDQMSKRSEHALLLWDFENVAPPKDRTLHHCVERIREVTGVHKGECRVFCNVMRGISDQRRQECQQAGLVLVDVPSRKPNASDMQIQVAMMKHVLALGKDSQGVVVLISGDSDFAEIGAVLRDNKIEFVLVHNIQANKLLRSVASRTYDFLQIIKTVSCSVCLKSFKTKVSLEQHQQSKHAKIPKNVKEIVAVKTTTYFSCAHCERLFQSEKLLVEHVESLNLLKVLESCQKAEAFEDESRLNDVAGILVMKRKLGILRDKPNFLVSKVRLQLMLDMFCAFRSGLTNLLSLAVWLIVDPEDINYSGSSALYVSSARHDEDCYGITPLIVSCWNDDVEAVRFIIHHFSNVNVNTTRSDGCASLHIACNNGILEIVRLLLQHPKTNINMLEEKLEFRTGMQKIPAFPLQIAIRRGRLEVVRELLLQKHSCFHMSPDGWTYVTTAITCAFSNLSSKDFLIYDEILDIVLKDVTISAWMGIPYSGHHFCTSCAPATAMIPDCFRKLVEDFRQGELKKDFTGASYPVVFYVLSECRHDSLFNYEERLIRAKALTNKLLKKAEVFFSPKVEGHPWERSILFAAVETNDVSMVKTCLNFSETSRADSVGCSPLLVAAVNSNIDIVRLLLLNGAFLEVSSVRTFLGYCKQRSITAWVTVAMECFRRACSIENVAMGIQWTKKTVNVLEEAMESSWCVCF
jgi:ankyrin repeat protein